MGKPRVAMPGETAQRRSSDGVTTAPVMDGRLRMIGNGKPLETEIRDRVEKFFGADFSGVRVHVTPAVPAMGALALTLGETLYFAPGLYDPTTREGVELLGHELTHVVQQRSGRVVNPYGRGVAIVQDPELEAEADSMGRQMAEHIWPQRGIAQAAMKGRAGRGTLQASASNQAPALEPPLAAAQFVGKNALIQASYKNFIPHVGKFLDCGMKIRGLLEQLRKDLGTNAVDQLGLAIRIVRNKDRNKTIKLEGGWEGEYHVYMRSEDVSGRDLLYDPYINASNCRGNTSEDTALPVLWETDMGELERITVAGVGTDIKVTEYMECYQGNWGSLVKHAKEVQTDPSVRGEYIDW
ncbi:MAG TPA: DUF4157 domain-containing protein [Kofleriaceae bacterium]